MNETERNLWIDTFRASFLARQDAKWAAGEANVAVEEFRKAVLPA